MKVWVLAPYGHRLHINGVFFSIEKAHEHVRDMDYEYEGHEDDWVFPSDSYFLEEFEVG